ncbi:MAG: flagellar export chaperone FliS [bacterium]|nr:flagellar export chaperone FliS [bacterium]
MAPTDSYKSYQKTQIKTASPAQLVVLLYEGAIQRIRKGQMLLHEPDRNMDASTEILRAMNIISELFGCLNPKYSPELSKQLADIYAYVLDTLAKGLQERDTELLDKAGKALEPLASAWREVAEGVVTSPAIPGGIPVVTTE